jgi:phage shock protein A
MTNGNGRIGGDRTSKQAKAARANLVDEISAHRRQLDDYIRELRRQHGDSAVDQALALLRQRERINVHQQRSGLF